ncbi:MAG: hypothetical protein ACKOU6_03245 [Planctomycetota bacterium]
MADQLRQGIAWLAKRLQSHASRTITYRRGAAFVTLSATLGRKDFETDTQAGRLYFQANDFLVRAADLQLGAQRVLPERGDEIEVEFDGVIGTFEVLGQDGIPPWEYSDPHQIILRIHTKKVV